MRAFGRWVGVIALAMVIGSGTYAVPATWYELVTGNRIGVDESIQPVRR